MEEGGAQMEMAAPIFMLQTLSSPYSDAHSLPKKRAFPYPSTIFHSHNEHHRQRFQNHTNSWNPLSWEWDTVNFISKQFDPKPSDERQRDSPPTAIRSSLKSNANEEMSDEAEESIQLNLGGRFDLNSVEEAASKPSKRVRSGSPGGAAYPICQVDNCMENLSSAKDYHRRHKVCELHSKSTKALVAKQMQRFCQQCSRFHLLSEFDEGKRSCRRRLAGHNRRRRKTLPEDPSSHTVLLGNQKNSTSGSIDIVNFLAAVSRAQGKVGDENVDVSSSQDCNQLVQILNKINSLQMPMELVEKFPDLGSSSGTSPEKSSSLHQINSNGNTSPSTMDLLTVLSSTLAGSSPDALSILSQKGTQSCVSTETRSTTRSTSPKLSTVPDLEKKPVATVRGERSSTSYQSSKEDSDSQVQEIQAKLPLQLFSSSPEVDSPKSTPFRKYCSSDSSNPIEVGSPSSSPPFVQELFPMPNFEEAVQSSKTGNMKLIKGDMVAGRNVVSRMQFDLLGGSNSCAELGSFQSFPHQLGYTSFASDNSPSTLISDIQDRTGQIIFKLFDKDPSHFPVTLRAQIYNWLSKSPSEMESFIRPGCVVLSIYVSMSPHAWDQLEDNLMLRLKYLLQSSDSGFWRSGRFLVNAGRQLAAHKNGKIYRHRNLRARKSPELIIVSPLAVVGGQQTSILLRGKNLTISGTRIHCTQMGGFVSKEVAGLNRKGSVFDEVYLDKFQINDTSHGSLGRCFIEVENGFQFSSFPVIIADFSICEELSLLESEFIAEAKKISAVSAAQESTRPRLKDEMFHFLNELGWLFQRKRMPSLFNCPKYVPGRSKFLLTFSVERDYCALVRTILDILVDEAVHGIGISRELAETLSETQLLNRAIKRRCRKMVDLLVNYSVFSRETGDDGNRKLIFPPNLINPGGVSPLHVAASLSGSYEIIDALTNDPQEIGLNCWNSLLDDSGQSPFAYAKARNNHSYNQLVAQKLADRRNSQVSVTISNEIAEVDLSMAQELRMIGERTEGSKSCARCAILAAKRDRRSQPKGFLQWPYIHSMLAVAAVCVCVCLFMRGDPDTGLGGPIIWEELLFCTI